MSKLPTLLYDVTVIEPTSYTDDSERSLSRRSNIFSRHTVTSVIHERMVVPAG